MSASASIISARPLTSTLYPDLVCSLQWSASNAARSCPPAADSFDPDAVRKITS